MPRTKGAKNVRPFDHRTKIPTTAGKDIRHIAQSQDGTPLERFSAKLAHQRGFLNWIDSRHKELQQATAKKKSGSRGPKDAVYRKYRWYAEQQCLLEAITAFEVFYKETIVGLANAMRFAVPPERIKGTIDAQILWAGKRGMTHGSLMFEGRLYHNLATVDEATGMLIDARCYDIANAKQTRKRRIHALKAVFQMRHTLAHNQGHITQSDRPKYLTHGYEVSHSEVIDPTKDHLGRVVKDFLESEAKDYTDWVLKHAAAYLATRQGEGAILEVKRRKLIERLHGKHPDVTALQWT